MVRKRRGEGLQPGLEKKAAPSPVPMGAGQTTEIGDGRQVPKIEHVCADTYSLRQIEQGTGS